MQSITRLPEAEAFAAAKELSAKFKGTAFVRFEDFVNYYPRRIRTEKWLYDCFIELGGQPANEHPLYFVLQGSEYLNAWFNKGKATKIPLKEIQPEHISFTFGDSMAMMDKPDRKALFLMGKLFEFISHCNNFELFIENIKNKYIYIEVQLWNDKYIKQVNL